AILDIALDKAHLTPRFLAIARCAGGHAVLRYPETISLEPQPPVARGATTQAPLRRRAAAAPARRILYPSTESPSRRDLLIFRPAAHRTDPTRAARRG